MFDVDALKLDQHTHFSIQETRRGRKVGLVRAPDLGADRGEGLEKPILTNFIKPQPRKLVDNHHEY